ncbi:unnamed protein product, partial [Medioppia subpectinata]
NRPLPVPPNRVIVVPDLPPPSKPLPPIPAEEKRRNSGLFKVAQRPEDLDVLVNQLTELGANNGNHNNAANKQRKPKTRQQEAKQTPPPLPPPVVDSDDDEEETEDSRTRNDGTLLASDPPRPLAESHAPNRPLPPPPDVSPPTKPLPPIPREDSDTLVLRREVPRALPDLLSQHVEKSDEVSNLLLQYRQSCGQTPPLLSNKQRSFLTFGFSASGTPSPRRESHVNVNVSPALHADTPEIRKYKKRFNSEILCAALWGVNLLIGTESGLMLLDRSGQGKVYQLISRRRFQQMEVLEGQNILITISGKKARVRVYYLSWLKSKIIRTDGQIEKRAGWINVGDLQGAIHFKIVVWLIPQHVSKDWENTFRIWSGNVKYERIKFLVIALRDSVEIYAWAPKPYHKFMAFKSFSELAHKPLLVDMTIEEGLRLKVIYGSTHGFHAVDLDYGSVYDIYIPQHVTSPVGHSRLIQRHE